jgi:hypothetical protein
LPAENQVVTPTFNIQNSVAAENAHLFVYPGINDISFAVLDISSNTFSALSTYHLQGDTAIQKKEAISEILLHEPILKQAYYKTDIIWCTEQNMLTPQEVFNKEINADSLNLLYGDEGQYNIKYELILKLQAYNVYRINASTEKLFTDKFAAAIQSHQSTLLVNIEAHKPDLLYCNFLPGSMTVLLRQQKQLQIIQTFKYQTPEDAVYYLLNVCRHFAVSAPETQVTVSGMIDESSALCKELFKYFQGINFLQLPDGFSCAGEMRMFPVHYFSHLFITAACV